MHDPFGHLKHKLWPKEGSGVKLPIWLPTTKSRESLWFPCMQVACHIPLESSWQGLQLCFEPHLNQMFTHKIMGLQSCESPNFRNFEIPTWESWDKMDIWLLAPWPNKKNNIRGKVVAPPSLGRGESFESVFACGVSMHQKCSNYALTNLLFSLCRSVWIIELFITLPNPHPWAPTCPSTPKCCKPRNMPQLLILSLFSP